MRQVRQTISVKFYARTSRPNPEGHAPVYMRIQIKTRRFEILTKIYVKPEEWSSQNGKLKTNSVESRRVNKVLDGFKLKAFDYQRELMDEGKVVWKLSYTGKNVNGSLPGTQ